MEQAPELIEKKSTEKYKEQLDIFKKELRALIERVDYTNQIIDGLSDEQLENMQDYFETRSELIKDDIKKIRGAQTWDTLQGDISVHFKK